MSIKMILIGSRHLERCVRHTLLILFLSIQTAHGGSYQSLTDNILGSYVEFRCTYTGHRDRDLVITMVKNNPTRCILHGVLSGSFARLRYCEDEEWDPSRMKATMDATLLTLNMSDLRCSDTGDYSCIIDGGPVTKLLAPVFSVPTVLGIPEQYKTGIPRNTKVSFICYAKTGVNGEGSLSWRLKGKNVDNWLGETGPNITVVRYTFDCTEMVRSRLDVLVTSEVDKTEVFCFVINPKRQRKLIKHSQVCLPRKLCGKSSPISINVNSVDKIRYYKPQRPKMTVVAIFRNASGYYDVKAKCSAFVGSDGRLAWYLKSGDGQKVSFWPFYSHGWPDSLEFGAVGNVTKGENPSKGPTLESYLKIKVPISGNFSVLTCTSQSSGDELDQSLLVSKQIGQAHYDYDDPGEIDDSGEIPFIVLVAMITFIGIVWLCVVYYCLFRRNQRTSSIDLHQPTEMKEVSEISTDSDMNYHKNSLSHSADPASIRTQTATTSTGVSGMSTYTASTSN